MKCYKKESALEYKKYKSEEGLDMVSVIDENKTENMSLSKFNEKYEISHNSFLENEADIIIYSFLSSKFGLNLETINKLSKDFLEGEECFGYCRHDWIFENEYNYEDAMNIVHLIDKKLNEHLNLKELVSIYPWSDDEYGLCLWDTKYVLENKEMFYEDNEELFDKLNSLRKV